ncbi:MAG: tRNA pseudouridine(55) synthase TruB [Deltaproteobacteria bacterium]|nr:tRNA pseudouridine(55) synthase TruB [Deltaproteobacteria bacterium]
MTAGVLVLDKPEGITSFDAVRAVGRILGERKCGHAGTLDPMATGVLPVCVGAATKIAGYLSEEEKEYEATFSFGAATDTGDATGKPVETHPGATADEASVAAALSSLVGTFLQVPPAYSAVKVGGVRSYALARKGKAVPLAPRRVTVSGSRLLSWEPGGFCAAIACSKGFYIRALSRDLGERLGVPMTVARLRRLRVGAFRIDGSVTLDALRMLAAAGAAGERLIPIVDALHRMPAWAVPPEAVDAVRNGRLAGPWLSGCVAGERGDAALLVTGQREPLAIVGRDPSGLWKILRGI